MSDSLDKTKTGYLPSRHFSIQYSCIRLSPLNSGWKEVTSFLPFLTMTFPRSSGLGSPNGESEGGGAGWYSTGNVAKTSTSFASSEREWMAGARMNIVLNGFEGFDNPGMTIGASNDSSWAKSSVPHITTSADVTYHHTNSSIPSTP